MSFRITGLEPAQFTRYFGMSEGALAAHRALRRVSEGRPGYPCRVSLDDVAAGGEVILINYEHLPVDSPYRATHAIYVAADSRERWDRVDEIPPALARRLLSLRAFDRNGLMVSADVTEGAEAAPTIEKMLADAQVDFIHAHYARAGCFAARIDRA